MNTLCPHTTAPTRSQQVLAVLLGGTLAVVAVAVGVVLLMMRSAVPELTTEALAAALQRWDSDAPTSYAIETQVKGLQPAMYRVEVRDDKVIGASRNGNALRDQRTLGTWSVPGMFGTIERDLQTNADAERDQAPLQLRAEFHPQFGYPQRYVRLAWGTKITTSWVVHSFAADRHQNDSNTP